MADRPRRDPGRRFGPSGSARDSHDVPRDETGGREREALERARERVRRDAEQDSGSRGRTARERTAVPRPGRDRRERAGRDRDGRERPARDRDGRDRRDRGGRVRDGRDRPTRDRGDRETAARGEDTGARRVPRARREPQRPEPQRAEPRRPDASARRSRPSRSRPGVPPPRLPGDRASAPTNDHHRRRRALRTVVAVLSALSFLLTGTAWAALSGSLSTSSSALGGGDTADGATDILLVGTDSRTDAQGRPLPANVLASLGASQVDGVVNTDTMMLVRVPNDGRRAVAFSIPRDSYVPIPGRNHPDKINSAYPAAKAAETQRLVQSGDRDPRDVDVRSSEAGRAALVGSVQNLTGLTVDHYSEVNLLGFFNLTQAVGGVQVCLNNPVDDQDSGAHFPPGPRTVQGHDALAFVRQRHGLPNGDLDRIRRQQAFLASLSHTILSAGTLADPATLSRLLSAVKQSVVLDGGWDLLGFASQMQGISGGSVAFMTIPTQGSMDTPAGADALRIDPAEVQRYVRDAISGPPPAANGPDPATVPVDIRNASGRTGAAGRVLGVLGAHGFVRTVSGNADPAAGPPGPSAVLAGTGADAGAKAVAGTLGNLAVHPDPTVPPGTVRVLLGADYTGPGALPPAAGPQNDAAPAPPPPPPITAVGVPCVN